MKNNKFYRRSIFVLLSFSFFLIMSCNEKEAWVDSLPKPWTLQPEAITEILPEFHERFPDFQARLKAFTLWQVGKPYELFCLGEEVEPDPDPILRLDVSDCTVHVLSTLAFVQSRTWDEARKNMINIHYKPNKDGLTRPTYKSRWHYTADRLQENPSTLDITQTILPLDVLEKVDIELNRKVDGSPFLDLGWSKTTTVYFIPNDKINQKLLRRLPEVCGVAFVKKKWFKMGLVIGHEGMIIDRKNIIHASSEYGETVTLDFMEYYFRTEGPLFDGIMVYAFTPLNKKGGSHPLD